VQLADENSTALGDASWNVLAGACALIVVDLSVDGCEIQVDEARERTDRPRSGGGGGGGDRGGDRW
jgi:hypothetical protein